MHAMQHAGLAFWLDQFPLSSFPILPSPCGSCYTPCATKKQKPSLTQSRTHKTSGKNKNALFSTLYSSLNVLREHRHFWSACAKNSKKVVLAARRPIHLASPASIFSSSSSNTQLSLTAKKRKRQRRPSFTSLLTSKGQTTQQSKKGKYIRVKKQAILINILITT